MCITSVQTCDLTNFIEFASNLFENLPINDFLYKDANPLRAECRGQDSIKSFCFQVQFFSDVILHSKRSSSHDM